METLGDKILLKICSNYYCEKCDYGTSKKSSFNDHMLSAKHKKNVFGDIKKQLLENSASSNIIPDKIFIYSHT